LIGQILDFSRKSVSQQLSLDLVPFMKESIKFLERTIPENVRIVMEMTPGEFTIQADPTKIQQVITNLAVNARDAMPAGGELRVHLADLVLEPQDPPPCPDLPPGDWVVLSISDTGDGIPENILPHIYEPFFTTKDRGKGTGLGLAQVYGIIKQHHGYVDVKSKIGQGTTFTIYFPALLDVEPKTETETRLEIPRGHGETILLVEDEADVLVVNRALLEELGYRLLTATNGRDALEIYAQYQAEVELVLTDMVMPEMDGAALVEALKAHNPNVKVILISGYPLDDEAEAGEVIGAEIVSWVQKPVDLADLAQVIARTLAQ
jgi:CheY-like chemotaxis protein